MEKVICVYCKNEITGCCYPAFNGTVKIGYRHINCFPLEDEKCVTKQSTTTSITTATIVGK